MSKKSTGLMFLMVLVLAVVVFAAMFAAASYAGVLPWDGSQFVAFCAGSTGGSCGVG